MEKGRWCLRSVTVAGIFLLCCGCAHGPTLRGQIDLGRHAFSRGEVLEAYRALGHPVVRDAATDPDVADLLREVTAATEHLIARWVEKAEYWLKRGNLARSLEYFDDIAGKLPPGDGLRREMDRRAGELREKLLAVEHEIEQDEAQARQHFQAGEVEKAQQKLTEAYLLAQKNQLQFGLAEESLLEECNRRLPTRIPVGLPPELFYSPPKKEHPEAAPSRKEASAPAPRSKAAVEPPREEKARPEITDSLTRAVEMLRRQQYVEAIEAFREVLALDAGNREARAALEELEPKRRELIKDFLERADQHFAKQELERAVPFYQQVLRLDPGNQRAREGLQMHQRLEELKRQKPAPKK